jgi:eukaryotic-like serine/threonine-protein kinase
MDDARWQRLQTLFQEALELPAREHLGFLTAACGDDAELRNEVLAMLEQDARGDNILDRSVAELANQSIGSASAELSSKEFGPYRVIRVLGEGGMGVVYLATRPDLGNQVAIKVLRDAWLSPARRERFAGEQRTLAQLNHPSIAQLYDADTLEDGTPWFVMEHVEGLPLTEYCRQHHSPALERLQLFRAVCEAVQYAHGHAVIHRDLKPSNILVKNDATVRLLDFGIAKQMESLESSVDQTMTGLRLMTPAYAAPEQIRGDRVGVHTDVYSLGVILYELLTGQLPFDLSNLTPSEAAIIISEHDPGRPSAITRKNQSGTQGAVPADSVDNTTWADLDVLCLTAMHKDPNRRYRSVEALIRDIDHYLKGEPLEARPDSLRYRVGKFVKRNRRAVTAASLVFATLVTLVVFFTVRLAKARNAALDEAARTQRIQHFMMDLFQGGDEAAGPSDDLRVATLLDRGVQEAQALNGDPKEQAELYETLGGIYQKLGKLDRADKMMQLALDRHRTLYGADSRETAGSLIKLGLLRSDQARLEEAEQLVQEGLAMTKRYLPPNDPAVGRGIAALGMILENRGSYPKSISVLDEAVRLQSEPGTSSAELASTLSELANSHYYAGHHAESDSINRRVLLMRRQLYGERHPLIADTLINLGAIQFDYGNYQESEKFNREALDIMRTWYGKDHPETASALTILGRTLVAEGRSDDAADMLREALRIQEQVYGKVHPRVASVLNELGKIAKQQGKLHEAEADFSRMAEIYRSVYKDNHYLIAIALSNLGSVYFDQKDYGKAEATFRDVVKRFTTTLSAEHFNTGIARIKLGRALVKQKRYEDAEVESRAGYEVLVKQTNPSATWLQNARLDLAEEYEALKRPGLSARFRTESEPPKSAQLQTKR